VENMEITEFEDGRWKSRRTQKVGEELR